MFECILYICYALHKRLIKMWECVYVCFFCWFAPGGFPYTFTVYESVCFDLFQCGCVCISFVTTKLFDICYFFSVVNSVCLTLALLLITWIILIWWENLLCLVLVVKIKSFGCRRKWVWKSLKEEWNSRFSCFRSFVKCLQFVYFIHCSNYRSSVNAQFSVRFYTRTICFC